jgi:hypothetical protein
MYEHSVASAAVLFTIINRISKIHGDSFRASHAPLHIEMTNTEAAFRAFSTRTAKWIQTFTLWYPVLNVITLNP